MPTDNLFSSLAGKKDALEANPLLDAGNQMFLSYARYRLLLYIKTITTDRKQAKESTTTSARHLLDSEAIIHSGSGRNHYHASNFDRL